MKITHQQGDPRDLILLEENARYMPHETYKRLVAVIKRDGVLQQWPFVWHDQENARREVLSGNHRVKASIDAGLDVIDWTECDEPLTHDERVAIQLRHNALVGEDDPAVLKRLYESIQDVDERLLVGLDDKMLELLHKVSPDSLSEANLDFQTVLLTFLPPEKKAAADAFEAAEAIGKQTDMWLCARQDYQPALDALAHAKDAYRVSNTATALALILAVFNRHIQDIRAGWLNGDYSLATYQDAGSQVPLASLGLDRIPAPAAALIAKALDRAKEEQGAEPWQVLEAWAMMELTD